MGGSPPGVWGGHSPRRERWISGRSEMRAQWGNTPRGGSHFLTSLWEEARGFDGAMSTLLGDNCFVMAHHAMLCPRQTIPLKPSVIKLLTERWVHMIITLSGVVHLQSLICFLLLSLGCLTFSMHNYVRPGLEKQSYRCVECKVVIYNQCLWTVV